MGIIKKILKSVAVCACIVTIVSGAFWAYGAFLGLHLGDFWITFVIGCLMVCVGSNTLYDVI